MTATLKKVRIRSYVSFVVHRDTRTDTQSSLIAVRRIPPTYHVCVVPRGALQIKIRIVTRARVYDSRFYAPVEANNGLFDGVQKLSSLNYHMRARAHSMYACTHACSHPNSNSPQSSIVSTMGLRPWIIIIRKTDVRGKESSLHSLRRELFHGIPF